MRISDWSSDVCSSDLGGEADLVLLVVLVIEGLALLHIERQTIEVFLGDDIDDAGDSIRAVNSRSTASEDFDAIDEIRRNGIEVDGGARSEEHTSELQSLMRISYAVFCLTKKIIEQVLSQAI